MSSIRSSFRSKLSPGLPSWLLSQMRRHFSSTTFSLYITMVYPPDSLAHFIGTRLDDYLPYYSSNPPLAGQCVSIVHQRQIYSRNLELTHDAELIHGVRILRPLGCPMIVLTMGSRRLHSPTSWVTELIETSSQHQKDHWRDMTGRRSLFFCTTDDVCWPSGQSQKKFVTFAQIPPQISLKPDQCHHFWHHILPITTWSAP